MVVEVTQQQADDSFANIKDLFELMGAFAVSSVQRNIFEQTDVDGKKFPERYPGMADPKVNIAGFLRDLIEGREPPKRRFQDRPVLQGTGDLVRSIQSKATKDGAEVGSSLPDIAARQNFGLPEFIAIAQYVRDSLTTWLEANDPDDTKGFRKRLGFIFGILVMESRPIARKFIGVNENLEKDLASLAEEFFSQGGNPAFSQALINQFKGQFV